MHSIIKYIMLSIYKILLNSMLFIISYKFLLLLQAQDISFSFLIIKQRYICHCKFIKGTCRKIRK